MFSTSGGVQYIGGYHECIGGYHEYFGGIQYIGDIMMHVGDIMSTSGDVQYVGVYHDACGDIMMPVGEQVGKNLSISIENTEHQCSVHGGTFSTERPPMY